MTVLQVKTDEYTMHNFHLIKYCHLNHFGSALGLAGLAVVWQVASQEPYNLNISSTVFKVSVAADFLLLCCFSAIWGKVCIVIFLLSAN